MPIEVKRTRIPAEDPEVVRERDGAYLSRYVGRGPEETMGEWQEIDEFFEELDERDALDAHRLEGLRRLMEEEWHAGDEEQD